MSRPQESDEDDSEGGSEEEEEHEPGSDDEDSQGDEDGSRKAAGGDWYDVDDEFIDDSELLDGPEDAGKAKRNGFFINKACALAAVCGRAVLTCDVRAG